MAMGLDDIIITRVNLKPSCAETLLPASGHGPPHQHLEMEVAPSNHLNSAPPDPPQPPRMATTRGPRARLQNQLQQGTTKSKRKDRGEMTKSKGKLSEPRARRLGRTSSARVTDARIRAEVLRAFSTARDGYTDLMGDKEQPLQVGQPGRNRRRDPRQAARCDRGSAWAPVNSSRARRKATRGGATLLVAGDRAGRSSSTRSRALEARRSSRTCSQPEGTTRRARRAAAQRSPVALAGLDRVWLRPPATARPGRGRPQTRCR